MNKYFKNYLIVWILLLALFNLIAFIVPENAQVEKYTPSFWVGYVFISLCFVGQLTCACKILKEENLSKVFYNIPTLIVSFAGLLVSFVVGGLCMLISPLPYWVGMIVCSIVLTVNVAAALTTSGVADTVSTIDSKIKTNTFFIKSLTVDAETLMARAQNEDIKAECRKVCEAVRFSDPMSSNALAAAESRITLKFAELSDAVIANDFAVVKTAAREVIILVEDRNKKCKLLK